jgi:hypothetical protein
MQPIESPDGNGTDATSSDVAEEPVEHRPRLRSRLDLLGKWLDLTMVALRTLGHYLVFAASLVLLLLVRRLMSAAPG